MIDPASGAGRFLIDLTRFGGIVYEPYAFQLKFHCSPAPYGFMGGAAGPGKTTAALMELFLSANDADFATCGNQVQNLALRRTYPKLEKTVLTRARELFPASLYKRFPETPGKAFIEWKNGARTQFGAMQYAADAWDFQGQWKDIYYDELCEFMYQQWAATSAWNRCAVSRQTRKFGSGNPIGIGAHWVHQVFVKHRPCDEMDDQQKAQYKESDYPYFPATYLDNPIYANDPRFIAQLDSYPAEIRDALKYGKWGVAGGYFASAWDEAIHVYQPGEDRLENWHRRWISGDWGFEHWTALYKHAMDDDGVLWTYDELCLKHKPPEDLAEEIIEWCRPELEQRQVFENFAFSHDAFSSNATKSYGSNPNSVAVRMSPILHSSGLPMPHASTRDKLGREQLMYQLMVKRIEVGEDERGPVEIPAWRISSKCQHLIEVIPRAPRDELDVEKIAEFLGDDPLQGCGYGLYAIFGKPAAIPKAVQLQKVLADAPDNTALYLRALRFEKQWGQTHPSRGRNPVRWKRPSLQ
jgi:Terminase large subunit, T4likevirus-type, N-terminal